jgi:hypothetical protein
MHARSRQCVLSQKHCGDVDAIIAITQNVYSYQRNLRNLSNLTLRLHTLYQFLQRLDIRCIEQIKLLNKSVKYLHKQPLQTR